MSCSAGDIACEVQRIANAIPAGPSGLEVWTFWVTVVNVAASIAIAIAALVSSRRALRISERSDARETARDEAISRDRVDRWLADFIVAANAYLAASKRHEIEMAVYGQAVQRRLVQMQLQMEQDAVPTMPTPPLPYGMFGALDAALLVARDADRDLLSECAGHLRLITMSVHGSEEIAAIEHLSARVTEWRSGQITIEELRVWLRSRLPVPHQTEG